MTYAQKYANRIEEAKKPDTPSKRSIRRAKRNFTGTRAQRRNERRLAWKSVSCSDAGTSPQELSFEGTIPRGKNHMQYRGGGNSYH